MTRIVVNSADVADVLRQITEQQQRKNVFVNVQVLPYTGKKYDPDRTAVIKIG